MNVDVVTAREWRAEEVISVIARAACSAGFSTSPHDRPWIGHQNIFQAAELMVLCCG